MYFRIIVLAVIAAAVADAAILSGPYVREAVVGAPVGAGIACEGIYADRGPYILPVNNLNVGAISSVPSVGLFTSPANVLGGVSSIRCVCSSAVPPRPVVKCVRPSSEHLVNSPYGSAALVDNTIRFAY